MLCNNWFLVCLCDLEKIRDIASSTNTEYNCLLQSVCPSAGSQHPRILDTYTIPHTFLRVGWCYWKMIFVFCIFVGGIKLARDHYCCAVYSFFFLILPHSIFSQPRSLNLTIHSKMFETSCTRLEWWVIKT